MAVGSETLIVLGAGASKDFGLPLGEDLKEKIRTALNIRYTDFGQRLEYGDRRIVEAYRYLVQSELSEQDINPYLHASREIADAMPLCGSIDDYLEKHQGSGLYEVCGKVAIARCILEAESKSKLASKTHQPDVINSESISESWMSIFMQMVTRGVSRADIASAFEKMLIVNFNYDRCFEIYVYHWLKGAYRLDSNEAAQVVNKIQILRPYGSLGPLPLITGTTGVNFGADPSPNILIDISRSVKTYSESSEDKLVSETIASYLARAKKIAFFGFAFHNQNMRFFDIPRLDVPFVRHVFASTYKIPQPRWTLINNSFQNCFKITSDLLFSYGHDGDCREFWNEFGDNIIA